MPMDVFFEILEHLKPHDLLRLTWTSKELRQILMSKTSMTIWKTSRHLPTFFSIHSAVYCVKFCHTAKVQKVHWGAFVRCCKGCSIK
ncbi:hypothetical protein MPER_03964, partial [Moniliophthora perniciosa FA553]